MSRGRAGASLAAEMALRVPLPPDLPLEEWDELTLLAAAVWGEARGESPDGQVAVADVVLNRVRHPGWWGRSIHEVLLRDTNHDGLPEQFSCFRPVAKGGQLELLRRPLDHDSEQAWHDAFRAAALVIFAVTDRVVNHATHYVATSIPPPGWTKDLVDLGMAGHHHFYRVRA